MWLRGSCGRAPRRGRRVVAVGGSQTVNQTPNRQHVAPIAAWLTDKLARATDAAHLSDSPPSVHSCLFTSSRLCVSGSVHPPFNVFIQRRKRRGGGVVAAVFGFMTTCSGIRVTTACVIAL